MEHYYQEIIVWKHINDGTAVRFNCFRNLKTGKYAIQSEDYYRLPVDEKQVRQFEEQFLELFIETEPSECSASFDSLDEAIKAWEEEFS
ncbi:MAG: hypothetical protein JWP44_4743 [Mucilaginibacter sp.]|nr:hypothetical protein [Mucilaginibacter sp.]